MAAIRTPDVTYVNSFLQYQENGGHANSWHNNNILCRLQFRKL
jgi:hypothetical protein